MTIQLAKSIGPTDQTVHVTRPIDRATAGGYPWAFVLDGEQVNVRGQSDPLTLYVTREANGTFATEHGAGTQMVPLSSLMAGRADRTPTLRTTLDPLAGPIEPVGKTIASVTYEGLPGTPRLLRLTLALTTRAPLPGAPWWVMAQPTGGMTQTHAFPAGLSVPPGMVFLWTGVATTQTEYHAEIVTIGSDTVGWEPSIAYSNLLIEDLGEPA